MLHKILNKIEAWLIGDTVVTFCLWILTVVIVYFGIHLAYSIVTGR